MEYKGLNGKNSVSEGVRQENRNRSAPVFRGFNAGNKVLVSRRARVGGHRRLLGLPSFQRTRSCRRRPSRTS